MKAILRGQLPVTAVQTVSSRYARGTRRAGRASFRLRQMGDGAAGVRVRVLFVCLDNSCRSRMAEVFANHYGSDVLRAESAGIRPVPHVSAAARHIMREHGLEVADQPPKGFDRFHLEHFDLIVNLSGHVLPPTGPAPVLPMSVPDPAGRDEEFLRQVRDRIDDQVMHLVRGLRSACVKYTRPAPVWQTISPPKAMAFV
jgi:arsenate reductase